MNCPGHILIYKRKINSYRDLPVRYFELGTVYRHERSGVLHGLLRVRGFTQDDAHIFCRPDQLQDEIKKVIDFAFDMLKKFGFEEFEVYLSTKPEDCVGSGENWKMATAALEEALKSKKIKYDIDPGAGVFYGPKIDVKLKDAIGRSWQGPTIQVDFNLPERFDLHYIGEDGAKHRPVMIHRVVLGSMERFIGALTEHYAGAFPLWLAPVQVIILPIADRHVEYSREVERVIGEAGRRVEVDDRREKIGLKIREAQLQKIPYMLVVGDKEVESKNVAVRSREKGDLGAKRVDDFLADIRKE
jgi:threonyl-tRNA synthetase